MASEDEVYRILATVVVLEAGKGVLPCPQAELETTKTWTMKDDASRKNVVFSHHLVE
jgi:hypothetical protein